MNPGRSKLWLAFWGGVLLVIATLSWASWTVYALEQRNAVSRAMNQRQEVIRLALWRMDSRLAPMIALEAARPIEDYRRVLDPVVSESDQPVMRSSKSRDRAEERTNTVTTSSLQAVQPGEYAQGYFEIDGDQTKGSGERAKEIASRAVAMPAVKKLDELSDSVNRSDSQLQSESSGASESAMVLPQSDAMTLPPHAYTREPESAREADYQARQQIANLAQNSMPVQKRASTDERKEERDPTIFQLTDRKDRAADSAGFSSPMADSESAYEFAESEHSNPQIVGVIVPRWIISADGTRELVLVRTIERDGTQIVQGVWLDWNAMSSELIESIRDLLPTSTLQPIIDDQIQIDRDGRTGKEYAIPSYRLATVPVAFTPGGAVAVDGDAMTPAMLAMLVTWIAVIGAMIAVGFVLRTVLNLSARRGRFVGAVTHELRTPLTTFRLYSQMLADGMVTDEGVRKEYLNTLKRESDRLTGIVENVLEYARLSRHGTVRSRSAKEKPKGEQQLSVGELMARIVPPMSRLGEQSGMDLIVSDLTSKDANRTVTLDPHAIERIMMNLMDNACKYAGSDAEKDEDPDLRVHLDASVSSDALVLVVADHGPGVPGRDRRKIFGEFVRGSSGTMRDRSGLGLGLALSRGLALEMGGDLSLVRKRGHGAEFELRVPLDELSSAED